MNPVKYRKFNTFSLLLMLLVAVNACSDDNLRHALDRYCKLFDPESIFKIGDGADLQTVYADIQERQSAIKSERLNSILALSDKSSISSYYVSIKSNVEKELGEAWRCDDFDQFFLPKQKVVSLLLTGVQFKPINPLSDKIITIMLAHSGELLVNNNPLKDYSKLKPALASIILQAPIDSFDFVLYFDEGSNGELISDILATLTELGVSKVGLIDM